MSGSSSPYQSSPLLSSSSGYRPRRRRRKRRPSNPFAVNVTQPLQNLNLIPDDIPIIIGTNKHEGEMFVHGAFPLTMSKAVYWMFVGALFKDSAPKVLKHYRPYVKQLEAEAEALGKQQLKEEENKQYFKEHQEELEEEYERLLKTTKSPTSTSVRGGSNEEIPVDPSTTDNNGSSLKSRFSINNGWWQPHVQKIQDWTNRTKEKFFVPPDPEEVEARRLQRIEQAKQKAKEKALKEAAKVAIDYRPVMSRIINDYLFRCPSWHYAHLLSLQRMKKYKEEHQRLQQKRQRLLKRRQRRQARYSNGTSFVDTPNDPLDEMEEEYIRYRNNVYVYRFSQPTHVPGFKECKYR